MAVIDDELRHPAPEVPRSERPWIAPLTVGAVTACGCAAIALVDPGDSGTPLCWSKAVFGVDCPFCGGLRCVNALLRGNWAAAADHNVLFAVLLPVLALAWVVWLVRALRGRTTTWPRPPSWVVVGIGVFLLAFAIARNVGGPDWVDWLNSATYRG